VPHLTSEHYERPPRPPPEPGGKELHTFQTNENPAIMIFSDFLALGFGSDPIPNGGTYTLTTYLGVFLRAAEEMAGPRDQSWTILGVEFFGNEAEGAVPHIWYPGNCRHVVVRLTRDVAREPRRAVFQLAHEAAHLISPEGRAGAPNLEEGFATILGHNMAEQHVGYHCRVGPQYMAAYDDTQSLLSIHPEAIRLIREIEAHFELLTPEVIAKAVPDVDSDLATRLCRPWRENDGQAVRSSA
jgi:hypothetical protein